MQPLKSLYSKDYALFYSYFHKAIKAESDKSPPPKVYLRRLQHIVLLQQYQQQPSRTIKFRHGIYTPRFSSKEKLGQQEEEE
jgi:hypothetical protein